jgi:hypothetical protein
MKLNEVKRYTYLVTLDLHDDIDEEGIKDVGRQIECAMCNVDYALGQKLLWKSRTKYVGEMTVKKT